MNKSISGKIANNQLDSLVLLRGIAVIMVCCCHFGGALSTGHIFSNLFISFYNYGKYGVHVFFVISGFVIPLSLFKGKYDLKDYPRFLYKRVLRLHPPYLAALFMTLLIMYFSYKTRHIPFPENSISILKSIVYFHIPADNPVFWTLIVEAQYYLFIGLFYAVLMKNTAVANFLVMPLILLFSHLTTQPIIDLQSYIVFFFIGNAGYMIYTNNGKRIFNLIALAFLLSYTAYFCELPAFIAALSTIACILFYSRPIPTALKFPGLISYSIYLIHFPLGIKLINFLKPKIDPSYSWLLFILTFAITFLVSWIFYKAFEEFSERISKQIKYRASIKAKSKIILKEQLLLSANE